MEDLATAEVLSDAGMLDGVGEVTREVPKENLLGSPWWTDGKRAVLWLTDKSVPLEELQLFDWDAN